MDPDQSNTSGHSLLASELRKFGTLRDEGFLSDEEFTAQKTAILAEDDERGLEPDDLTGDELTELADLVRTGVLTREEFDAQKAQLLWTFEDDEQNAEAPGQETLVVGAASSGVSSSRRQRMITVIVVALLVGAGLGIWRGTSSGPSTRSQFYKAWLALDATKSNPLSTQATRDDDALTTFALRVGNISFPAADVSDAHRVIRDALTVAQDDHNATWEPATSPTVCTSTSLSSPCLNSPGYAASWSYPASYSADLNAFNRDASALYAELGG